MDDFAGRVGHHQVTPIQVSDDKLKAAECLRQADGLGHIQVVAVACENLMLFLLENDDHVPWLHVRLRENTTINFMLCIQARVTMHYHTQGAFTISSIKFSDILRLSPDQNMVFQSN